MEVSKPKCVNPDNIQYGVNLLRLGGLQMYVNKSDFLLLQE